MHRLGLGHERVTQLGLELHRADRLFRHGPFRLTNTY
jgi:hypothetical protein